MEVIKWGSSPECGPLGCATDALLPPNTGGDSGGNGGPCCFLPPCESEKLTW